LRPTVTLVTVAALVTLNPSTVPAATAVVHPESVASCAFSADEIVNGALALILSAVAGWVGGANAE
jgi:hypothetical protein